MRVAQGAVLVLVCLLAVGGASAVPAGQALVVSDADTGDRLLVTPVQTNTTVALEYTHSVEKTRVLDAYTVRGDELVMTRMEFESYGAGLPSRADVRIENGTFVFDPDGSYEELYVTPGDVADHRLHVGSRTHDLVALSDGQSVRLSLVERSALDVALSTLP
jgi:hypothetical protein